MVHSIPIKQRINATLNQTLYSFVPVPHSYAHVADAGCHPRHGDSLTSRKWKENGKKMEINDVFHVRPIRLTPQSITLVGWRLEFSAVASTDGAMSALIQRTAVLMLRERHI